MNSMTPENKLIASFIAENDAKSSIVTLGGTGPNGSSQVNALMQIGYENLEKYKQVNIVSASSISYLICRAVATGGFNPKGYARYDKKMRQLHHGSLIGLIMHFLSGRAKHRPFFKNEKLHGTVRIFLENYFLNQTLSSLPHNVIFWVFCKNKNKLVELTAENYPNMTFSDVCRACFSIPALHGPFLYGEHAFVDPSFTDHLTKLRRRLFSTRDKHLFLNIKKQGIFGNVTFVKNQDVTFPTAQMFLDFTLMCSNIANPRVNRTHRNNLKCLGF